MVSVVATINDTGYQKPDHGMDAIDRCNATPAKVTGVIPRVAD